MTKLRERYHVFLIEFYGWLAGKCLILVGKHAVAIKDWTTFKVAYQVVEQGVQAGWNDTSPARKAQPNRGAPPPIPTPPLGHMYWEAP